MLINLLGEEYRVQDTGALVEPTNNNLYGRSFMLMSWVWGG
jgi:hypothetical protein